MAVRTVLAVVETDGDFELVRSCRLGEEDAVQAAKVLGVCCNVLPHREGDWLEVIQVGVHVHEHSEAIPLLSRARDVEDRHRPQLLHRYHKRRVPDALHLQMVQRDLLNLQYRFAFLAGGSGRSRRMSVIYTTEQDTYTIEVSKCGSERPFCKIHICCEL